MIDGWWSALGPLVGVALAGVLSMTKDAWLDRRVQSRARWYSAMRIVCALELYAEGCLAAARDEGTYEPRGPDWDELSPSIDDPVLQPYPSDIDWKPLNPDLVYSCLRLPVQIAEAERLILFMFSEIAGPPDYDEGFEERQFQYAGLGLTAHQLADDLRRKYKLPSYAGESPAEGLQAVRTKWEDRRAVREKKRLETSGTST